MLKCLCLFISIIIISVSLPNISFFNNISFFDSSDYVFENITIGENFGGNVDGYYKKVSENYCLVIDLGENTKLVHLNNEERNRGFFDEPCIYNNPPVLNGHYIYGYFNDDYLILCEEKLDGEIMYLSFEFNTKTIDYYHEDAVLSQFKITKEDFFSLSNEYKY